MILGIVQARMGSSRLPGKVLLPLLGEPALVRQMERVMRAKRLDEVLVATTENAIDDRVAELCHKHGWRCFRGSESDVLDRFYHAASARYPDQIVRLTGDNPLAEPTLIDDLVDFHLQGGFDFSSNGIDPTLPDGLDAAIFSYPLLETAWREAALPSEREHVTLFFQNQRPRFRIGSYRWTEDLSRFRWTLDEPEDYELLKEIFASLYPANPSFAWTDVLALMETRPELRAINAKFLRNEGLARSLSREKKT